MTDEHVRNQVVKSVQRAYSMEMNKHVPNGQRRSVNIHKIADTAIDAYESALEAAGYAVVPKDFMDEEDLWPVLRGHEILKRKVAEMRASGEFKKETGDE